MSERFVGTIVLIGISVMLSGCATISHGSTEKVTIDSTPRGADVLVDSNQHFTTPVTVYLDRSDPHTLVFDKVGYQEDHEALTSSGTGSFWGNYGLAGLGVVGILAGYAVDKSSGASNELSSNNVKVTLVPTTPQAPPTPPSQGTATKAAAAEIPRTTNASDTNPPP